MSIEAQYHSVDEVQHPAGCRYSLSPRGSQAAQGDSIFDGARRQLDVLGDTHVGYASRLFAAASGQAFAVVGGRPFSKVRPASALD